MFSQLDTIVFVHQNPLMRRRQTKYYNPLIISRRVFLNIVKKIPCRWNQLHGNAAVLNTEKSPGKTCGIHLVLIRLSDWPNHGQNISFLHLLLWLHPSINKNLDANKKTSLKINEHLPRGNKAIKAEQNEHWKQQHENKPPIQHPTIYQDKSFPFTGLV